MTNGLLLWVDDEIEQLRAHIMFLEKKGYEIVTVSNGTDAIDQCRQRNFDLVLLDEQMPGISGLETLRKLKEINPSITVVMVTKSEEENIMEQAIGQKIADYQARKPQSDSAYAQEEYPSQGNRDRDYPEPVSAELPADSDADNGLSHVAGLGGCLQAPCALGAGA